MNSSLTELKEIKKFGLIAFFLFGSLFSISFWRHKIILSTFFGVLCLLGFGFIISPEKLKGVYFIWLKVGHKIGELTTLFILTLAYYLVVTPVALLKRLFGGKPLPVTPDKDVSTYWIVRTEPAQQKERFFKRY